MRKYRKIEPVYAEQAQADGSIETLEGVMQYHAGDYLVTDRLRTHIWPVKREVFERTYVEDDERYGPE